jgi:hypothetical protein
MESQMSLEVTFGVKTSDLEQARGWVERATGLAAEARESDSLGGDYYAFRGPLQERLRLVTNKDVYDGEPVWDFPSWDILLSVERTNRDSGALRGLESDPKHFEKLETRGS